jgi:diacylglycerol kinase (ATP)
VRIGVLNNLRAGKSDARVTRLLQFLKSYPEVVSVETSAIGAVPEALAELASQEVDVLAINGGDGTLAWALGEILGNRAFGDDVPMIAPLRGGRTNMSALDLGSQRDPVKGMAELIKSVRSGRVSERVATRNVLRVEHGHSREVRYGMFFGVGMIQRAIGIVQSVFPKGKSQGVLGGTIVTGGLIARIAMGDRSGVLVPDKVDLLLDRTPARHAEYSMLIASTLDRLFAGMRPFWGEGPGPVRVTGMAAGCERLGRAAPGILRGKPLAWVTPQNGYMSENVKSAELRMDCGFTVDGEIVLPQPGSIATVSARDSVQFVRA